MKKQSKSKYTKAYSQAEKQVRDEHVKELAAEISKGLRAMADATKRIAAAKEEIRVIQQDFKDLRRGKLEQIRARQQKDEIAKKYSRVDVPKIEGIFTSLNSGFAPITITTANMPLTAGTNYIANAFDEAQSFPTQ